MNNELLPCPFCGAGTTEIEEHALWQGMKYSEPISVSVVHWCEPVEGQPSRMIQKVGRDRASAIAAWNRRTPPATGAAKIHIVFHGPPGPEDARFVEVETPEGRSIRVGEWRQAGDYWHLVIPRATGAAAMREAAIACVREQAPPRDVHTVVTEAQVSVLDRAIAAIRALPAPEAPEAVRKLHEYQKKCGVEYASRSLPDDHPDKIMRDMWDFLRKEYGL